MLTQSYSESFYNLLLGTIRKNSNDPSLPQEDKDKANKLCFLLSRHVEDITTDDGEKEIQITWYERTCYDLVMQMSYGLMRSQNEKLALEHLPMKSVSNFVSMQRLAVHRSLGICEIFLMVMNQRKSLLMSSMANLRNCTHCYTSWMMQATIRILRLLQIASMN